MLYIALMDIAQWSAQLRKGAAELVVLSIMAEGEDRYGLQILEKANGGGDIVSEGALYPLLSRLEKDGKLASRWVVDDGPHPRKFYRLTRQGAAALPAMTAAWIKFRTAMSGIVETGQ
jgi:PadR family transcriptional regulator PadR